MEADLSLIVLVIAIVLLIAVATVLTALLYSAWRDRSRFGAITAAMIDQMRGADFEQYLGSLLRSRGYTVKFTKVSGDFGADIVATKKGHRYSIQAKRRWRSIDRGAVADAVGAMAIYHCSKSMVITNSYFTKQARQFAKANQTQLVDRDQLADWISAFSPAPQPEPTATTGSELGYTLGQQRGEQLAQAPSQDS